MEETKIIMSLEDVTSYGGNLRIEYQGDERVVLSYGREYIVEVKKR